MNLWKLMNASLIVTIYILSWKFIKKDTNGNELIKTATAIVY